MLQPVLWGTRPHGFLLALLVLAERLEGGHVPQDLPVLRREALDGLAEALDLVGLRLVPMVMSVVVVVAVLAMFFGATVRVQHGGRRHAEKRLSPASSKVVEGALLFLFWKLQHVSETKILAQSSLNGSKSFAAMLGFAGACTPAAAFLLFLGHVNVACAQSDLSQTVADTTDALGNTPASDTCDLTAWNAWLQEAEDDGVPNSDKIFSAELGCRGNLDELKRGFHGPPSHWEKFNQACKDDCRTLERLHKAGRTASRCTCEELGTCFSSASFWMCKTLWECHEPKKFLEIFCDGCGTGQTTAIEFYDELDCGAAGSLGLEKVLVLVQVLLLAWLAVVW